MSASRLIDSLATTPELADLFSDRSVLQAMLDVEAALARAAAHAGAIPRSAAEVIGRAADADGFDVAVIARDARESATATIPVVQALTRRVRSIDPDSAKYVHWSATSQDISDSALLVILKRAVPIVGRDYARLDAALRQLSDAHARTVMIGRTLLQPAAPITFGLKAAGWWAAINRSWLRMAAAWDDALVLQFGGAVGTRAAAGGYAASIAASLAGELGLTLAPPSHTDRDRLGAFLAASALCTAALGKAARDIVLLMQGEVSEVFEPGGGSSTMPHKRNPSHCAMVIAAATRMPGLVSSFLSGMLQEHERSVGGWHAEWPTISAALQTSGAAVASMAIVIEGLTVDPARMRANLDATRGVVFSERAVMLLTPPMGREAAQALVMDAIQRCRESGQSFGAALRALPDVSRTIPDETLREIDRPESYLGEAETLRQQLLRTSTPRG